MLLAAAGTQCRCISRRGESIVERQKQGETTCSVSCLAIFFLPLSLLNRAQQQRARFGEAMHVSGFAASWECSCSSTHPRWLVSCFFTPFRHVVLTCEQLFGWNLHILLLQRNHCCDAIKPWGSSLFFWYADWAPMQWNVSVAYIRL